MALQKGSQRNMTHFITKPAIRVRQPLGDFYAVSLPASLLLKVTYANSFRIDPTPGVNGTYGEDGIQRELDAKRAKEISRYIQGTEAAFPNAIILGVNYTEEAKLVDGEDGWSVSNLRSDGLCTMRIPDGVKLATIIDGQHRVAGFESASSDRLGMELLCAVYLDLPAPFQAYLFAMINGNQKRVDKSLAYNLFGFDVENTDPDIWPPEKLAVYLCRRLNLDEQSPLFKKIKVVAENREAIEIDEGSIVSTATVVEGILALISQNPKLDRDSMGLKAVGDGRSRKLLELGEKTPPPLRQSYLDGQDIVIYTIVMNYFTAVNNLLWKDAPSNSYLTRTVGIQSLFDMLSGTCEGALNSKNLSVAYFEKQLRPLTKIDFGDNLFQASGKGRVRIKNVMKVVLLNADVEALPESDREDYKRITSHRNGS